MQHRALVRQRATILRTQSRSVQHMQRALVQMNIQLATVIADVAGASGQAILRAIVAGERDGPNHLPLCDVRFKAAPDELAASLQGHWRGEHPFALKQALAAFDFCGTQLAEFHAQIAAQLRALQATESEPAKGKKCSKARNAPRFDLRTRMFQIAACAQSDAARRVQGAEFSRVHSILCRY